MQRFADAVCAIQQLYRQTPYEQHIAPVARIFAQSLACEAALTGTETVLDIGTGTGVLARELAGSARRVIGVDISPALLRTAHTAALSEGIRNVSFILADAHTLACLPDACCDVALTSFGLGETDPARSLHAVARVLRPGGRFYVQEWGPYDHENDLRLLLDETLAEYLAPDVDEDHLQFRHLLATPLPWSGQIQDVEDYVEALSEAGFTAVQAAEVRPVTVTFASGDAFLAYMLAWAWRAQEIAAMSPAAREAFRIQVMQRLAPLRDSAGQLHLTPRLFRASAVRKH